MVGFGMAGSAGEGAAPALLLRFQPGVGYIGYGLLRRSATGKSSTLGGRFLQKRLNSRRDYITCV